MMKTKNKNIVKPIDNSKELEILSIKALREIYGELNLKQALKNSADNEVKSNEAFQFIEDQYKGNTSEEKTHNQFISFQKAMKVLVTFGQYLGLNPVNSISDTDISKIKFTFCSWKFVYTIIVATVQSFATGLCIYKLFNSSVSLKALAVATLYFSTWCTTIIFLRVATKWKTLVKTIFDSNLDEYIDSDITFRCNITSIVALMLSLVEFSLLIISKVSKILDCATGNNDFYEEYTKNQFWWMFEAGIPYNIPISLILQLNLIIISGSWAYSDIFIICMSMYLTSVLNEINKRIYSATEKDYFASTQWGTLREDYNRATHMVRLFDDIFSGLILVSFSTNLFFTCLQLFYVLERRSTESSTFVSDNCPNFPSGPFHGYEYLIYLMFSLVFLIVRFLGVALAAAKVNVASLAPTSALYRLPSYSYTGEVQRFLDQVHDDVVALGGLEYFYITKELVLSVAGTIVTYELVLLQLRTQ